MYEINFCLLTDIESLKSLLNKNEKIALKKKIKIEKKIKSPKYPDLIRIKVIKMIGYGYESLQIRKITGITVNGISKIKSDFMKGNLAN